MGWEFFLRNFANELAVFFKASGDRWSDAASKVAAGTYASAELQTDLTNSVQGIIALWTALLTFAPLPFATKVMPAADLTKGAVHLRVVLEKPITTGALTVGDSDELVLTSNSSKTLAASAIVTGALKDEISITVYHTSSPPDAGVYHAAVYHTGKQIVAVAIVQLT